MSGERAESVLVVDDERQVRRFLRAALTAQGYEVSEADARKAIDMIATERPDVIILDLSLPNGDGLSVVQSVREWTETPILILSVRKRADTSPTALPYGWLGSSAEPILNMAAGLWLRRKSITG